MKPLISKRNLLRGAGVAVALPWLESLAPKRLAAQPGVRKRFMPIYLPSGAPEIWRPQTVGQGAAWQLSSVMAPLAPLKSKLTVISGLENGSAFNADGSASVEPSHGRQPGAWLTCIDPGIVRAQLKLQEANRISMDQIMAKNPNIVANTLYKSLQVGCSSSYSMCDSNPCSNSRTVSWNEAGQPMYKVVDPLEVFNKLVTGTRPAENQVEMQKRIALDKSVLDAVIENTARTAQRLGAEDKARLDQFLTHVRAVELQSVSTSTGLGGLACMGGTKPTGAPVLPNQANHNTATYNKGTHADVMNDLIVMAFQCDATRIITHMLDDEASAFIYGHVQKRTFTNSTSTLATGTCGEWHNQGQHGNQNDYATMVWWNVGKVAELCLKLDAIKEGDKSILDNSVILFGSCMHGSNHKCNDLPITLLGGGAGKLKTDQHLVLENRWLRDLHYTIMKDMFGMSGSGVDDFGISRPNKPHMSIREILAA